MLPTKNTQDHKIRKEAGGQTVWRPLPPNILANIFDKDMAPLILNRYFASLGDLGSWNSNYGVYAHHKSGLIFVLVATQEALVAIYRHLGSNQNVWNITSDPEAIEVKIQKLNKLSIVIGSHIAVAQPVDYTIADIPTLIDRHFADNPGYLFVRDQGSNYPGTIRIRSVPTEAMTIDLPASHPGLAPEPVVKAQQQALGATDRFATSKALLAGLYNTGPSSNLVPNVNPGPGELTQPIEHHLVYKDGAHEFLNAGTTREIPLQYVGNDTLGNTAGRVYRGTPHESTMDGLVSNPLTTQPAAFFNPHPYWLTSISAMPLGILGDPRVAAALIAIALLYQDKHDNHYIENVNRVSSVVDNEKIEQELFGE